MKSETPADSLHALRAKPETRTGLPAATGSAAADFEPRYVDVPRRRRAQVSAERNLKWGLAVFLLALGIAGAALIVSGPRALLPLVVCLITFTILWVLARLRVFHQRNGVFFAAALTCLLGAMIPMIERGYTSLDRMVHGGVDSPIVITAPGGGPEPAPVLDQNAELSAEPAVPLLVEAFKVKPPVDASLTAILVLEDTKVLVGRKPFLIRAGDSFVLDDIKDGQVTFIANELRLSLPEKSVDIITPKLPHPAAPTVQGGSAPPAPAPQSHVSDQAPPGEETARAQEEAMRRYPAIGVKGSPENELFVQRFRELKADRPEFFEEPNWPLYLADAIAKEQGWQRSGK